MKYLGMDKTTGARLTDADHIRQSIPDILFTPLGTRIERRDYGSMLPELIDRPVNDALLLQIASASIMALLKWEPRVKPSSFTVAVAGQGGAALVAELQGVIANGQNAGQPISLPLQLTGGAA